MIPRLLTAFLIKIADIFGKKEQAVIVHFNYGSTDFGPLRELESRLEQAVEAAGVGDFDGDEIAVSGSDGYLYLYGPDADSLFEIVKPILESCSFMCAAKITKLYGLPGTEAPRVEFNLAL